MRKGKSAIHFPPHPQATGTVETLCGKSEAGSLSELEDYVTCRRCLAIYRSSRPVAKKGPTPFKLNFMTFKESQAFRRKVLADYKGDWMEFRHCKKVWKVAKRFGINKYLCPVCDGIMTGKRIEKSKKA